MPSIYAHYTFGEMMKQNFPSDIKKRIDLHKDLFEIGLHGPDLFFYYYAPLKNRVSQTGYRMHDVSAAPFFRRAKDVILSGSTVPEKMPDSPISWVFSAILHWTVYVTATSRKSLRQTLSRTQISKQILTAIFS